MTDIQVLYRLSDNSYNKPKIRGKLYCLNNVMDVFGASNIHLFIDDTRLKSETRTELNNARELFATFQYFTGGSSSAGFRKVYEYAISGIFNDDQIVLLQEDDHLYLPGAKDVILEGLEKADIVSAYMHNDRFLPASQGGNKFVDDQGSYQTRFYRTNSCFWTLVESTVLTFATHVKVLKEDKPVWDMFSSGPHPNDFGAFCELTLNRGRSLATPVPTYSSHMEELWCSPLIGTKYNNWTEV